MINFNTTPFLPRFPAQLHSFAPVSSNLTLKSNGEWMMQSVPLCHSFPFSLLYSSMNSFPCLVGLQDKSAPPWSPPPAAEESLLQCMEHLFHSFSDFAVHRAISCTFFPQCSHCHAVFCSFLHRLSLRCHQLGCCAQVSPVVGPLELAGTSCVCHGAAPASPH